MDSDLRLEVHLPDGSCIEGRFQRTEYVGAAKSLLDDPSHAFIVYEKCMLNTLFTFDFYGIRSGERLDIIRVAPRKESSERMIEKSVDQSLIHMAAIALDRANDQMESQSRSHLAQRF